MGTTQDFFRRAHSRSLTATLLGAISTARKRIFKTGRAVASSALHTVFNTESWVPVLVRDLLSAKKHNLIIRI
jgi:hypothetical protein